MTKTRFKTISLLLATSLTVGGVGNAYADWGRHDYRPPVHRYHEDGHHNGSADWIAPAAILAITGLAIGAAVSNDPPPSRVVYTSQPVYVAPPVRTVPPPPPAGSWYYCASSAQYYPYVRFCPEGWQAVMPTR